jgi:hypothetical protein
MLIAHNYPESAVADGRLPMRCLVKQTHPLLNGLVFNLSASQPMPLGLSVAAESEFHQIRVSRLQFSTGSDSIVRNSHL